MTCGYKSYIVVSKGDLEEERRILKGVNQGVIKIRTRNFTLRGNVRDSDKWQHSGWLHLFDDQNLRVFILQLAVSYESCLLRVTDTPLLRKARKLKFFGVTNSSMENSVMVSRKL